MGRIGNDPDHAVGRNGHRQGIIAVERRDLAPVAARTARGEPQQQKQREQGRTSTQDAHGGGNGEWTFRFAIAAPLHLTMRRARLGWVVGSSAGFLLRRDPDRLLSPDVAFISRRRLPAFPRGGFIPLAPDFVAEVKSPTDTWVEVVEKCGSASAAPAVPGFELALSDIFDDLGPA